MTAAQAKKTTIKARESLVETSANKALHIVQGDVKAAASHGYFSFTFTRGNLIKLGDPILHNLAERALLKALNKLGYSVDISQNTMTVSWG